MWLLCGYCVATVWLLCGCCVATVWLLCGYYVATCCVTRVFALQMTVLICIAGALNIVVATQ